MTVFHKPGANLTSQSYDFLIYNCNASAVVGYSVWEEFILFCFQNATDYSWRCIIYNASSCLCVLKKTYFTMKNALAY
jgi:hypothetical protein